LKIWRFVAGAMLAVGFCAAASAQQTKSQLNSYNNTFIISNGVGAITAATLHPLLGNMINASCTIADAANCPLSAMGGSTPGGLIYGGASSWLALPAGSAGQVLTSTGTSAPTWSPSGSSTYNINTTGGVVCHGVTVVSAAFQTAINAAAAAAETAIWTGTCVVSNISIPSNLTLYGSGQTTAKLLRPPSDATSNPVLSASSATGFQLGDFTVDGNSGNETNASDDIFITASGQFIIRNVTVKNAKLSGTDGEGIHIIDTTDGVNNTASLLNNVTGIGNGMDTIGLAYSAATVNNLTIDGLYSHGGVGVFVSYTPGTKHTIQNLKLTNFTVDCAGANVIGVELAGYVQSIVGGQSLFSYLYNAVWKSSISNGTIENCGGYGLLAQIEDSSVVGVHTINSGFTSPWAGILLAGYQLTATSNTVDWVGTYGIEAGGCVQCTISNNVVFGTTANPPATSFGIHVGGAIDTIVSDNEIAPANSSNSFGIQGAAYDGADTTHGFDWQGGGLTIANNRISCINSGACVGIQLSMSATLSNNNVLTATRSLAYELYSAAISFSGKNTIGLAAGISDSVASAATMQIPDDSQSVFVTGTTTVNNILTYSQAAVGDGVAGFNMTAGGSGYTSAPTATFTGGSCTIAPVAQMFIDAAGVVTGGQMSTFGTCTSTPTGMSFSGGGGTGAAATPFGISLLEEGKQIMIVPASGFTLTQNAGGFGSVFNRSVANLVTGANSSYLYTNVNGNWTQNQ